jgi:hypothetical protein
MTRAYNQTLQPKLKIENKGVIYRCSGRDPVDVDPVYAKLSRVTNLPQDTPPEIKDLLGCE